MSNFYGLQLVLAVLCSLLLPLAVSCCLSIARDLATPLADIAKTGEFLACLARGKTAEVNFLSINQVVIIDISRIYIIAHR